MLVIGTESLAQSVNELLLISILYNYIVFNELEFSYQSYTAIRIRAKWPYCGGGSKIQHDECLCYKKFETSN